MTQFRQKPGTKGKIIRPKEPFPNIDAFNTVVHSLIMTNPLGCTSYWTRKKHNPPLGKVREMYIAKFVYEDANKKRIGIGLEMYNSVEGYQEGIHSVFSNMANISAHRGKVRHISNKDRYSVILKCHDPNGEFYFLSIARDKVTLSNYQDDGIWERVVAWTKGVPELA